MKNACMCGSKIKPARSSNLKCTKAHETRQRGGRGGRRGRRGSKGHPLNRIQDGDGYSYMDEPQARKIVSRLGRILIIAHPILLTQQTLPKAKESHVST